MATAYWTHSNNLPTQELEPVVFVKNTGLDHLVILGDTEKLSFDFDCHNYVLRKSLARYKGRCNFQ